MGSRHSRTIQIAKEAGEVTSSSPIRIMLRLTPGIECHTHEYIRTGHLDSKFGFDPNQLDDLFTFVSQQSVINCLGLHAHIGSQIFETDGFSLAAGKLIEKIDIICESHLFINYVLHYFLIFNNFKLLNKIITLYNKLKSKILYYNIKFGV